MTTDTTGPGRTNSTYSVSSQDETNQDTKHAGINKRNHKKYRIKNEGTSF